MHISKVAISLALGLTFYLFIGQTNPTLEVLPLERMTPEQQQVFLANLRPQRKAARDYVEDTLPRINHDAVEDMQREQYCGKLIEELRIPEAVPVLMAHIDVTWVHLTRGSGGSVGGPPTYPYEAMLVDIGLPSIKGVHTRLNEEKDPLRVALLGQVIVDLIGQNPTLAMLEDWTNEIPADKRANSRLAANIQTLITRIKAKQSPELLDNRRAP